MKGSINGIHKCPEIKDEEEPTNQQDPWLPTRAAGDLAMAHEIPAFVTVFAWPDSNNIVLAALHGIKFHLIDNFIHIALRSSGSRFAR